MDLQKVATTFDRKILKHKFSLVFYRIRAILHDNDINPGSQDINLVKGDSPNSGRSQRVMKGQEENTRCRGGLLSFLPSPHRPHKSLKARFSDETGLSNAGLGPIKGNGV